MVSAGAIVLATFASDTAVDSCATFRLRFDFDTDTDTAPLAGAVESPLVSFAAAKVVTGTPF